MTDNEIIQALKCCINDDCDNCPDTFGNCEQNAMRKALDLINRQKAENEELISKLDELESEYTFYKISAQEQIESLIAGQKTLQKYIAEKDAEIERLTAENNRFADIGKMYSEIKSEAVKEFAERFNTALSEFDLSSVGLPDYDRGYDDCMTAVKDTFDNIKKEMVGDV